VFKNFIILLALVAAFPASLLRADPESRPAGIAARIWAVGNITSGQPGDLSLSGTYLHPDPSVGGTQYRSASTSTSSGGTLTTNLGTATNSIVRVEPGKVYQLIVGGQNLGSTQIYIIPPPGYRTLIDGIVRTSFAFSGGYLFYFQLEPIGAGRPDAAGVSTGVGSGAIEWHAALGELSNGQTAGVLSVIDSGTRSSWSPLFTPSMLGYESSSSELWIYRVSGELRQVISKSVAVDVVTINSTSYELKYYHPDQVNYSNTPRTFTGSAFATYKVSQGGTSTTLNFTKEIRDVTNTTSTFSVSRTEVMSLARTNSWPDFIWTRSPWTQQGQSAVSETTADSGGSGTVRSSEEISIQPPGGSTTVSVERAFTFVSGIGEMVASETFGSSSHGLGSWGFRVGSPGIII